MLIRRTTSALLFASSLAAAGVSIHVSAQAPAGGAAPPDVRTFLAEVDRELLRLGPAASRAGWVQSTYITLDTRRRPKS